MPKLGARLGWSNRRSPGDTAAPSKGDTYRRLARDGLSALHEADGIRRYQPLYGLSDEDRALFPEPKRLVDDRWRHIAAHLPRAGSALDIGSQHGWFTFKLAEHGLHAVGVEKSATAHQVAQWLTIYNQAERASFVRMSVDPDTVRHLPAVDVVLCMAVFHHWVRMQGLDAATAIMASLAERCRDRMVFETGQIGDTDAADRSVVAFMGDDPRGWITGFLTDLGFGKATVLAELSRSTRNARTRYLMLAER